MLTLIKGGRLLDPAQGTDEVKDLWLADDRVVEPPAEAAAADRVIEAQGLWVTPGMIDLHVHLREPGQEYKEDIGSGLAAAAAGGFSAICAMPNTQPANDTRAVTEMILRRAATVGGVRLYPVAAVSRDRKGEELTEFGDLLDAGAVAFSDDGSPVHSANLLRRALEYAATFDALVMDHPEDLSLSQGGMVHEGAIATRLGLPGMPAASEELCVARDILLAEYLGTRLHLQHVSCAGTVRQIAEAKARGVRVTAEVTPHHLVATDELLEGYPTSAKVNPPLRSARHVEALRQGLADGTIDAIATDHAPHSVLEKDERVFGRAAFGISGLESAVPLTLELVQQGLLSPLRWVETLSTAPAQLLGLPGGSLALGAMADVTLVNPEDGHQIDPTSWRSKGKNTPFAGREVPGRAVATFVGGRLVFTRLADLAADL
jgi:dihydroorotase